MLFTLLFTLECVVNATATFDTNDIGSSISNILHNWLNSVIVMTLAFQIINKYNIVSANRCAIIFVWLDFVPKNNFAQFLHQNHYINIHLRARKGVVF